MSRSADFAETLPTKRRRGESGDAFIAPTSPNFPLPEMPRPTLVEFEGAKMYITKELYSDESVSTTWYNFFSAGDTSATNLVSAQVLSKLSGKDIPRNEMVISPRRFYYPETADTSTVERWESQKKFGSPDESVAALRSKRGFKFLRLVQIDQAAEAVKHRKQPLVIPVVFSDAWRPYDPSVAAVKSTTPAFGQLDVHTIEGWIGGESNPTHYNSRLGDDAGTRDAEGWPTIVESLGPLFPDDSPETLVASGIAELEELELPRHDRLSVRAAANRIKKKDFPYGSFYGIIGDNGRVTHGTGSCLLD